jgi:hypothetical protein
MFEWTSSPEPTAGIVFYDRVFEFPCGDVRVQSDCREIFLEVEEATRYWETALRLSERHDFTFTLRWRQPEETVPLPPDAELLYRNHLYPGVPLEYFRRADWRIFRICGADVVAVDYDRGVAQAVTAGSSPQWNQQYIYNCIFIPPLIEWLGRHGIFMFHGGAAAWEEDGVVVLGPSGSGKTTAVLSLVEAGFGFLTDDIGLLFDGDKLRVSGLSEPFNLCPDTPRLFAHLGGVAPVFHGDAKQPLPLEALRGAQIRQWCHPRLLLFPEVRPELEVALLPLSRGEALELLLPNGMFLTGLKEGRHRFLAFLQLLETTKPMRLVLGKGMHRLPGLVKDALSALIRVHDYQS